MSGDTIPVLAIGGPAHLSVYHVPPGQTTYEVADTKSTSNPVQTYVYKVAPVKFGHHPEIFFLVPSHMEVEKQNQAAWIFLHLVRALMGAAVHPRKGQIGAFLTYKNKRSLKEGGVTLHQLSLELSLNAVADNGMVQIMANDKWNLHRSILQHPQAYDPKSEVEDQLESSVRELVEPFIDMAVRDLKVELFKDK